MKADKDLDCMGMYCPMPVYKAAEKMKELEPGQVLEVIADDSGITSDMTAWCKSTGNELVEIEEQDGEYHVFVRKAG